MPVDKNPTSKCITGSNAVRYVHNVKSRVYLARDLCGVTVSSTAGIFFMR